MNERNASSNRGAKGANPVEAPCYECGDLRDHLPTCSHAIPNSAAEELPLTMDDAIDMAALSDAGTCRILPADDHIEPEPRDA